MYDTYIKPAGRALWRRRSQTLINVLGLAVGLAACLLIGRYVADAWRYDAHHEKADRIVRITSKLSGDGAPMHLATSQGPLGPTLQAETPGVEAFARFISGGYVLTYGDVTVQEESLPHADGSVFDVFSFRLIEGDAATALDGPNKVVLSPDLARSIFGTEDPVGKTLRTDRGPELTVTGIIVEPPQTSHIGFEGLVSMDTHRALDPDRIENWGRFSYWTYVLLEPEMTAEDLSAALPGLLSRHTEDGLQAALTYDVMPLKDIYLNSDAIFQLGPTGDATAFRVFLAVAVFILLIAVVNFINLATARATERAREVGVRKTLGAPRSALVGQFLMEAIVTSVIATILAVAMARTALPLFHALSGTTLAGGLFPGPGMAAYLGLVAVIIGLLAGMYPALILAGYEPVRVLRGAFSTSRDGATLRRSLVVAQFAIAIALLAATGVVRQQLQFIQQQDLGFAPEQLVTIPLDQDADVNRQLAVIKRELTRIPGVDAVAASSYIPGQTQDVNGFRVEEADGRMRHAKLRRNDVDADFLSTYGLDLLAGRGYDAALPGDSTGAVIINEAAVRKLGYATPDAALGARINSNPRSPAARVVGVVKDFHFASLHERVEPLVLLPGNAPAANAAASYLTLRVRVKNIAGTMDAVRARWTELVPARPFEATFVDEHFAEMYEQDRRFGRLFATFAGLAIFVACLGLFGLTTHTVQQRTKEIGIRKALGATASSLVRLLSQDFAKLVGFAFVVGVPVAYLGMSRWLETFAYRIDLGVGVFALAGGIALVIALGTVGGQAFRAATLDPTSALRDE
ncbi:ABC transporter permease [Longibacter sp.]|uniref:ABC transporter permease n=1 Tax=Longibacter sp. TaxID=2045415 RepID=UPI003EB78671